jgi:hypothetical protein
MQPSTQVSDGAPQFASSERTFFKLRQQSRGNCTNCTAAISGRQWRLSHRRVAYFIKNTDSPRRVAPFPLPARWAPRCSFRSARSAQISRFSNFPSSLIIFFSFLLFLVPRFWFLVFGFWCWLCCGSFQIGSC